MQQSTLHPIKMAALCFLSLILCFCCQALSLIFCFRWWWCLCYFQHNYLRIKSNQSKPFRSQLLLCPVFFFFIFSCSIFRIMHSTPLTSNVSVKIYYKCTRDIHMCVKIFIFLIAPFSFSIIYHHVSCLSSVKSTREKKMKREEFYAITNTVDNE